MSALETGASAKHVPLDAVLVESLLHLRLVGPYNRDTDVGVDSPTIRR